ncbi:MULTISPECIES: sensor histidine kinase [Idiomarina]|uniref:Signal transduction ATPase, FimS family protein n=3 Tax=Idiomarina TaxID=135575 RepID=A0ABP2CRH3_9GAMM|nr:MULTISPECIES: histidine kinase [Idiomarina]EAQ31324.1 Signal transduction ATPase, FimS family protein [Idiomarina baltica OS145]MEC8926215.1 histidine kinase [Pseudomonadota bacterium]
MLKSLLSKSWFPSSDRGFWLLQFGGWAGYALVNYIGSLMHEMRDIYGVVLVLGAYSGFLLTLPLRYFYQRVWEWHPLLLMFVVILASYITACLWAVVDNATYWEIYKFGFTPDSHLAYFKNNIAKFYIVLSWSGLYFGIKYYRMLQNEKQKALMASSMAHQAQLKMLRYQLNPHFLFNSLNAISTLILVQDTAIANKMVNRLSHFLRFSLDNDPIKKITLKKEVEALMLYLDIEKVRFDERLEILIDVSDEAKRALVPSLLFQPLIENAIKYAIAKTEEQGVLSLKAYVERNRLIVQLCDNGPHAPEQPELLMKNAGVGLKNTRERLAALYGDEFTFSMTKNEPQGLCVEIVLPFETLESV